MFISPTLNNAQNGTLNSTLSAAISQPLPRIFLGENLLQKTADILRKTTAKNTLFLIADETTWQVAGKQLQAALDCPYKVLKNPTANDTTITDLKTLTHNAKHLIAVGSGTLNDLCKYLSYITEKQYSIIATAPSMNGYLSANASISKDGKKQSLAAHLPQHIFMDINIMAAAPKRLIQSGLGDSICRPTAQADWLLSHLLLNTPYTATPFDLLAELETDLFAHASGLISANKRAIQLLCETLLLSGLGMTIAGNSHPASQGEHAIAHLMESLSLHSPQLRESKSEAPTPFGGARDSVGGSEEVFTRNSQLATSNSSNAQRLTTNDSHNSFHGEQIAVTTLHMAELQQQLLTQKHLTIRNHPNADWPTIRTQILKIHKTPAQLRTILNAANCPTTPQDLGWNSKNYTTACAKAATARPRFGFLNLKELASQPPLC